MTILQVAATLVLPALITAANTKCPFLAPHLGPPITLELPKSALTHPLLDLPIEFRGVTPIVTRTPLQHGETPKVTIQRYSQKPDLYYDEMAQSVIVSSATCQMVASDSENSNGDNTNPSTPEASGASSTTRRSSTTWYLGALVGAAVTVLTNHQHNSPWLATAAATSVVLTLTSFAPSVGAQSSTITCEPVVQVLVQAPAAYKGAYDVCMEEINDPAICPQPFPTFPICQDPSPKCEVAVVGGVSV